MTLMDKFRKRIGIPYLVSPQLRQYCNPALIKKSRVKNDPAFLAETCDGP